MMKSCSTVLMIRPAKFAFNDQTAGSNAFQTRDASKMQLETTALSQFNHFVALLRNNDVSVLVIDDTPEPRKPDSIFPNNWISTHENGDVFLYPMLAENRRTERRNDVIDILKERYIISNVYDLSYFENSGSFLEGTGSMVLDREKRIAYACISPRTSLDVLSEFCLKAGYTPVTFHATDENGIPLYHTNVMMCVGNEFSVICMDSINQIEKTKIKECLNRSGKEIIEITHQQLRCFAGNIIQLTNTHHQSLIVMSDTAFNSMNSDQKDRLRQYGTLVHAPLDSIETTGGGSARCMIAEIYLPEK